MKKHVAIIQNGFGGPSILGWTDEVKKLETGAYRVYVNEWQPIETANEEPILGWDDYFKCFCIAYKSNNEGWVNDEGIMLRLTRWMPLPEPPEVE